MKKSDLFWLVFFVAIQVIAAMKHHDTAVYVVVNTILIVFFAVKISHSE